jgi:hypothetical protein
MITRSRLIAAAPQGCVRLVLVREQQFYLEIPINIIRSLCLKPRKYLLFLGWCILGVEGILSLLPDGEEVELEGSLDDRGVYYFVAPGIGKC